MKKILIIGGVRSGKSFLMRNIKLMYKKPLYLTSYNFSTKTVFRNIVDYKKKYDSIFIDDARTLTNAELLNIVGTAINRKNDLFIASNKAQDLEMFKLNGFSIIECKLQENPSIFEHVEL